MPRLKCNSFVLTMLQQPIDEKTTTTYAESNTDDKTSGFLVGTASE